MSPSVPIDAPDKACAAPLVDSDDEGNCAASDGEKEGDEAEEAEDEVRGGILYVLEYCINRSRLRWRC